MGARQPKKTITRFCKNCGKPFEIDEWILGKGRRRGIFCSVKCTGEYKSKYHQETRICKNCGKPFTIAKSKHKVFCSKECLKKKVWKRKFIEPRECKQCGKLFTPKQLNTPQSGKYCSKDCFLKAHTKYDQSKENRVCIVCGKQFVYPTNYQQARTRSGGKYCSGECYRNRKGGAGSMCRNILQKHHEMMKDDDDRLTTEFLVNMTGCKCKRQQNNIKEEL